VSGKFEVKDGELQVPKSWRSDGTVLDKQGWTCNSDGYLMDKDGNIIDWKGMIVFPASTLEYETKLAKKGLGTIPRIFQKWWIWK